MQVIGLKHLSTTLITSFVLLFALLPPAAAADEESSSSESKKVIDKYLQAREHEDELRGMSMEVEIHAAVPKRQESGTLRALRKISRVGQITYRVLAFQGANFVKTEIIARYLAAEEQGQGDQDIGITPANYKFKYKGVIPSQQNMPAYVFQLTPRKKKIGLFKGEIWIDGKTYLPVFEEGRLVKTPSFFFKNVDFRRGFAVQNGKVVPSYMASTIDTRLVGKVEILINFSHFTQNPDTETDEDASSAAAVRRSSLK